MGSLSLFFRRKGKAENGEWSEAAMKKNEIMPFAATWMDLEMIILSEISQTEKDKYLGNLKKK